MDMNITMSDEFGFWVGLESEYRGAFSGSMLIYGSRAGHFEAEHSLKKCRW
jgi:hypothetical protein